MVLDDIERFRERYATSGEEAVLAAEAEALGSNYRANGYTTLAQADEIGHLLAMEPGQVLLDIGAGCGWPGLYIASTHGCDVISLDPVTEGIRVARDRARRDGLDGRSWPLLASGEELPLRSRSVDGVVHTDVLC